MPGGGFSDRKRGHPDKERLTTIDSDNNWIGLEMRGSMYVGCGDKSRYAMFYAGIGAAGCMRRQMVWPGTSFVMDPEY